MPINEDYVREERIKRIRKIVRAGESHLLTLHDAVRRYLRMAEFQPEPFKVKGIDSPILLALPREDERDYQIALGIFADEKLHKTYTAIGKWLIVDASNLSLRDLNDDLFARFQALVDPIDLTVGQGEMKAEEQLGRVKADLEARVAIFTAQLKSDGEYEDVTPALRDAVGGWPHLRGIISDPVLDGYLAQMRRLRTKSELSTAIGAAKEITEATIKHVASDNGLTPAHPNSMSLSQWWKLIEPTLESAKVEKALGSKDLGLVKLLASQVNTVSSFGELRNKVGTGHGKAAHPAGLTKAHALLAIDTAHTLTRYLTA